MTLAEKSLQRRHEPSKQWLRMHRPNPAAASFKLSITTITLLKVPFCFYLCRIDALIYVALAYTGRWCCDNCIDANGNKFDLKKYTVGPHLSDIQPTIKDACKRKYTRGRPTQDRPALIELLTDWRKVEHSDDPIASSFPIGFIIEDLSIVNLAKAPVNSFKCAHDITAYLNETLEWEGLWAEEILQLIIDFDADPSLLNSSEPELTEDEDPPPPRLFIRIPPRPRDQDGYLLVNSRASTPRSMSSSSTTRTPSPSSSRSASPNNTPLPVRRSASTQDENQANVQESPKRQKIAWKNALGVTTNVFLNRT